MSGSDKWPELHSNHRSGDSRPTPPNSSRQNWGAPANTSNRYSWGTNANTVSREGTSGRSTATNTGLSASAQRRHSEQLPHSAGGRDTYRPHSPNVRPPQGSSVYGANSGSQIHRASYGHSNASPPVQPHSLSHQSTQPSTGPLHVLPSHSSHYTRERSMSTDSDSGATALNFEDGAKGRMHDVDDKVLISMSNIEVCSCMYSSVS